MNRIIVSAILGGALAAASPASAAIKTYRAAYTISGLSGSISSLSGSFVFTTDLNNNLIDNLAVDSLDVAVGSDVYSTANTHLDIYAPPFSQGARDFLIGRFGSGPGDTNNTLTGPLADFRFRFNLDANGGLILARGAYRSAAGVVGFDTSMADGSSATFGFAAVPEPASWALMIAGFGFTGAAMRRRRATAPAAV